MIYQRPIRLSWNSIFFTWGDGLLVEDADYVIANKVKHISKDIRAELVKQRWIQECFDMECWIPTKRYLLDC
jgi:hypothetical protein